jgi:hypothetical protein
MYPWTFLMGEICDKCEIKHILSHIFMFFFWKIFTNFEEDFNIFSP